MNSIPSYSENRKLEELFIAIYFNDLSNVIKFKKEHPELYAKKNNFKIDYNLSFDLTKLSYFNQLIWNDKNWREEIIPFVNRNIERTEQMLDFWSKEFVQVSNKPFQYNLYSDYFYCSDPKDFNEIIFESFSYYLEKGYREIDLKLYNRAECFDFEATKKLLNKGANVNIHFNNDNDSSIYSRISTECSFLTTCMVIPEFQSFEKLGYNQEFFISKIFGELLGLAAHEEMFKLICEYDEEN